jgi:FAD-dependent urate hydroxylase
VLLEAGPRLLVFSLKVPQDNAISEHAALTTENTVMGTANATDSDGKRVTLARAPLSPDCDAVIIGAGPYGLSAAAYLKAEGLGVRIFGQPMEFWADKMPAGMLLRSPRVASTIADPKAAWTLESYEAANGVKPAAPLPLSTFVDYGLWFQQHLTAAHDNTEVAQINRQNGTFKIDLKNGSSLTSRRVVVAAGIGPFRRIPQTFAQLSPTQVSHCYEGVRIPRFAGKRVAVIGSGQSALECAALLHEGGADVEVIVRRPELRWIGMHGWLHHLGLISKLLYSKHDVGPVGISRLVAYPNVVYRLPLNIKDKIRTRAVRPAGSNWLPARLATVKISVGQVVDSANTNGEEVQIKLRDGSERRVDHVLLGTGYQVDISRYSFLSPNLIEEVQLLDGYPDLAAGFRSSVPGLHFIGATAARNFGPLLYFVTGTEFCSHSLARYISKNRVEV